MTGTTLLIGGTGKTGLPLAHLLQNANLPFLVATRHPKNVPALFKGVAFDWFDASTFENPFKADPSIDRVYLVGPTAYDMLAIMKPFIDLAISKGVKRFVLLSSTPTAKGAPFAGKVHEYLADLGVDYAVLRPTWFIENFGTYFLPGIVREDVIISSAKDGRVPFVSSYDIADVAYKALTDEKSHNTEHIIVGPDLYSCDEVAALLSDVLGRKITHKRLSDEEGKAFFASFILSKEFVDGMVATHSSAAQGSEEACFRGEVKDVGKRHLLDYFKENRDLWVSK
ncbi:Agroclavine dehydrogenase [Hypsizygus marmoreus]|uniref:Agroclavine dehydrogenase n=1 Tax=Hypsizygus marmoreus TaxID=39966 RepID=A0A369K1X4_HYPMA|nr:Agroclavine dehydrogenase [Hypsizygus marmoreus]